MSKPVKDLIASSFKSHYEGVQDACVVDLTGLDVQRTQQLRSDLRSKSMRLQVVKNSLARRAFAGSPLAPLGERLRGPCALVTGGDSVIEVAKTLAHWAKELGDIALKEAMVDGDPALLTVLEVSRMKSRHELIGEAAMLVSSPGRALAGCVGGPARRIAGCLKALADREEAA
ncbi:MAG TPA: 50S ribosomal protein L10 [Phycisphaerae bacterium]|nr:50S ribosomal protein L10 [Phycisphaerae bacterium]